MKLPPQFPLPVDLRWTGPRRGEFESPFVFESAIVGRVTVEKGFDTDFASVPRGLWNLYPPDGDYSPAAFIHDALYWHQATDESRKRPVTREEADRVFAEAMLALGINWLTRSILFRAVRFGGADAWADNYRARTGEPIGTDPATPAHIKRHFHKLRR